MTDVILPYGENNINVGPLKEIPEICVDRFVGDDLKSSAFFLSHAHTDHMVGLESLKFLKRLKEPGVHLYLHCITPILLETFQRYLGGAEGIRSLIRSKKIVHLTINEPQRLELKSNRPATAGQMIVVYVTLLSAGHCPGSVMFLFETGATRVLHTGDFRLKVDDFKAMDYLHVGTKDKRRVKKITHLYIDTTFCSIDASLFPDRKEVMYKALGYIEMWLSAARDNWILIRFAAKYAHEYILIMLYEKFNKKIHVTAERYKVYKNIPQLCDIVTCNPYTQTPFHFCDDRNCLEGEGEYIELRLTSMWYIFQSSNKDTVVPTETVVRTPKQLKVCYSMHSSLSEIVATIDYLKPRIVTPLVMPYRTNLADVKQILLSNCKVKFLYQDYRSVGLDDPSSQQLSRIPMWFEKEYNPIEEFENIAEDENSPNSPPLIFSPEREPKEFHPTLRWNFNFSPSPKKSSSETSGSLPNSQEDKNMLLPEASSSSSPVGAKPCTPRKSVEKETNILEPQCKRALKFPSPLVSTKKLEVKNNPQEEEYILPVESVEKADILKPEVLSFSSPSVSAKKLVNDGPQEEANILPISSSSSPVVEINPCTPPKSPETEEAKIPPSASPSSFWMEMNPCTPPNSPEKITVAKVKRVLEFPSPSKKRLRVEAENFQKDLPCTSSSMNITSVKKEVCDNNNEPILIDLTKDMDSGSETEFDDSQTDFEEDSQGSQKLSSFP